MNEPPDDPYNDAIDEVAHQRDGKVRRNGWPKELPGHDADLHQIRDYLNAAAQLPAGYAIVAAERTGQYGSDPMTVTIATPGRTCDWTVRFRNQRDASKPGALRGALGEASHGLARMKYPTPAQASDFYTVLLQLASVASESTVADETIAWLVQYVEKGDPVHASLASEGRYDTLQALRNRSEFDRVAAQRYLREDLEPGKRWTILVDDADEQQWVRAGEFATFVRHILGVQRLAQHALDALVHEAGGERIAFEEDRRRQGFGHPKLVLYRVPSVPAVPTLYAKHDD